MFNFKKWLNSTGKVSQRIAQWAGWQTTINFPFPAAITGNGIDDLLAVLAGSKPAAIVDLFWKDPDLKELLDFAEQKGLKVVKTDEDYIVGKEPNVDNLVKLLANRTFTKEWHKEMGENLGYMKEAIKNFLDKY